MKTKHWIIYFFIWVAYFSVLLLTSCKTKYVTVPEYHTQYVVRTDSVEKVDSFYLKDSVYVWQKGDTVYRNRIVYQDRLRYINRVKTDSFIRRDTIYVPKPVERELTKTEQRYITLGKYAIGAIIVIVIAITVLIIWLIHRKKMKNENNYD